MESSHKQICRTCLVEAKENQTLHFIYDSATENSNQSVSDLLLSTIPNLHIEFKDVLPENICKQCLDTLVKLADFQRMCLQSEHQLFQLLGNGNETHSTSTDTGSMVEIVPIQDPLKYEIMLEDVDLDPDFVREEIDEEILGGSIREVEEKDTKGNHRKPPSRKCKTGSGLLVPIEATLLDSIQSVNNPDILNKTKELKTLNMDNPKKSSKKRTKKQITHEETNKSQTHQKDLVCEYCNKVFQRRMALRSHIRVHSGEQPYLCSECGKSFAHYTSLQQHLERHSGEKRYECSECPKKFRCPSDVYSHKLTHAKIKRHICDICGTGFVTFSELKTHKMRHNGEKPHKCAYCDKRFVLPDHMRRHQRTHTGEKPYKCQYCIMAYAQSSDLMKHLRAHLGENVYRCELCPQRFRLAREVREHFVSHKNEDEATRFTNLKALQDEEIKLKATLTTPGNNVESGINDV